MAKKKAAKKAAKKDTDDTTPGYAGPQDTTVAGIPPDAHLEKPEGAVIGEAGGLTKPTEYSSGTPFYKVPTKADRIVGWAVLEGDTFNGYHRKVIVELGSAMTHEGAFYVFKSHHPDAIFEGFKAKGITREEGAELQKKWQAELDKARGV